MNPITINTLLANRRLTSRASSCRSACIALGLAFTAVNASHAQVSTVNSVIVQQGILDSANLPNAVLSGVTNYPSLVSFSVTNAGVGTTNTSFSPIQDVWQFSVQGQTNAYMFQSNDLFNVTMNVTLTGSPVSPRKEAGFAFNDVAGNINGQYILDTDAGEVVAFGGNLPFYATPLNRAFQSGDTITMGITMLIDANGKQAIVYSADGISSPPLEFGSPQTDYTLGGYLQIQGQSLQVSTNIVVTTNSNLGLASFANISIAILPPALNIAAAPNDQVALYWTAAGASYNVQSSTNLSSTNWTTVTNGERIIGITVPASLPATYYRLQAQ
jgi:hypothetical protein